MNKKNKNFGIYVHVPFCVSKCEYCSFVSGCANVEQINNYINALCEEITFEADRYKNKTITSIYFGGGTPSFIDAKHIEKVLNTIKKNYMLTSNAEISIECNPCSFTKEKAEIYKNAGINRISFGVQSLNDNQLKILGRKHTKDMAISAIKLAKEVGFDNISADLMIGIPNQKQDDLNYAIDKLSSVGVKHISAYMLMVEEGTPLYEKVKNGKLRVADDETCVDMYSDVVKLLKEHGFKRYEISNFARLGFECKHNINYWDMGEYVGFGLASHSYVSGERFSNPENMENYFKLVEYLKNNKKINNNNQNILNNTYILPLNPYRIRETLKNNEIIEETIMLGLRQEKGVSIDTLNGLGYNILEEKKEQINILISNNIVKIQNNHIKLTQDSFGLCSAVVLQLI